MSEFDPTDAVIVTRCQLGDRRAWDELVHRWSPRLWAFVSRMVQNRSVAEDIVQIIWVKVVRSLGRLQDPEHLHAWMFRIARLSVTDQLRAQYRAPPGEPNVEVGVDDRAYAIIEACDEIVHGLNRLHPVDREAIILHYLQQLSISDVADICDVPPGTIKSRLYRARRTLNQILQDQESHND